MVHGRCRALSGIPAYPRRGNARLQRRGIVTAFAVFAAPSVTHYDHLQFGPALSTPDSLDAHGDLYFHFTGLNRI